MSAAPAQTLERPELVHTPVKIFETGPVKAVVERARAAQRSFANVDQETADTAVRALAWSLYQPEHARELAELAVEDTGLGNVPDKIIKKQRKTFGTLRDLLRVRSVGIIEEDRVKGLVKYAKPMGVVAAVTPSTNPGATPVNKAMMAIKGRNAVVIAPSPLGYRTTARAVEWMRAELERAGLPADLVQILPEPVTKEATVVLMQACDLVVVTGSQDNVKRAYSSGTPAIGVGAGNVPVIIDESADLDAAADKIRDSKIFDNSTSCSSENAVVILDAVYDKAIAALERAGAYLCNEDEKRSVVENALGQGQAQPRSHRPRCRRCSPRPSAFPPEAHGKKFFLAEETGVGKRIIRCPARSCPSVLTVYRAKDFAAAKARVCEILEHQGKGHSCGIHTTDMAHARELAEDLDVVRVLVNFAHTFGNGGGFNSGLELHPEHGLRLLAEEQHFGEPELPQLPQHHRISSRRSPRTNRRSGTVWAALGKIGYGGRSFMRA